MFANLFKAIFKKTVRYIWLSPSGATSSRFFFFGFKFEVVCQRDLGTSPDLRRQATQTTRLALRQTISFKTLSSIGVGMEKLATGTHLQNNEEGKWENGEHSNTKHLINRLSLSLLLENFNNEALFYRLHFNMHPSVRNRHDYTTDVKAESWKRL